MPDTPKTLLEMVGADTTPAPLSEAAVLLIDIQNEYRSGALPLPGVDAAVAEAVRLIERARSAGAPVIVVTHCGRPGGAFDPEAEGGRVMREIAPLCPEPVVEKALPNAFAGTDLQEVLEKTGRKQIIVAGFMTHLCVSSTVRAALDLGFRSTVVASACATRDLPDQNGGVIEAADLHRASLAALADRFAAIAANVDAVPD